MELAIHVDVLIHYKLPLSIKSLFVDNILGKKMRSSGTLSGIKKKKKNKYTTQK